MINWMINSKLLFFIYATYFFLVINILVAWIPNLSLILIGLRDAWMILFFIILLKKREYIYIVFLLTYLIIGANAFLEIGFNKATFLVYSYGARDLFLIALVSYFLTHKSPFFSDKFIWAYIYIILLLASLEVISYYLNFQNQYKSLFRTQEYFDSKGIVSNLAGGINGDRVSIPFYSPALLCTMFSLLLLLDISYFKKSLFLIISIFTSSKVLIMVLLFKIFNKYALYIFPMTVGGIMFLNFYLPIVIEMYPQSFYSYHSASILDHIKALYFFNNDFISLIPGLLGESSIASLQILGKSDIDGPESLLFARFLDFKLLSFGIVFFLIYIYRTCDKDSRINFLLFLMIISFSSLSNHPVAYIPFLFLLRSKDNLEYEK